MHILCRQFGRRLDINGKSINSRTVLEFGWQLTSKTIFTPMKNAQNCSF